MKKTFIVLTLLYLLSPVLSAQIDPQTQALLYRTDPLGNREWRKTGIMDGNLVRTLFKNDGQVGTWVSSGYPGPSGEWPKGSLHNYTDGCTPVISTRLRAPGNNQYIYFCQTSYREVMDTDPNNNSDVWGMEPVPGYAYPSSTEPAISTHPASWPTQWPRVLPLITPEWDGYWYGYFGRGVENAQSETFFVLDDSRDKEWKRPPYNYFPIISDSSRGGLGLRMEARGFQWSHVLAEDIIFWHYDIINISDFDYDSTLFGFYSDTGVGGYADDTGDSAAYDISLDLAYAFDRSHVLTPAPEWWPGYMGYAYLESPGNATDGINNDGDVDANGAPMVDETRSNHFDDDKDWVPYLDVNANGIWDAELSEPLNNDVGQDGVGPFDEQYNGPDAGEGNGSPDDGEPNFEATDKDESDQIGLTSLVIKILSSHGATEMWPKNDDVMWQYMQPDSFDTGVSNSNIQILFASGPFPLKKSNRERFSMALVWGSNLDDLFFNKETVQEIYNANYNFTKPPLKPRLTAIPGDKKVFLYWDSRSEQSTDPFLGWEDENNHSLGPKKDFEGYLIYKSEEAEFQDIKIITDSKGEPKYWKPFAQFDIVDGIKGPDPIGINGAHFWRGNDTGLKHTLIDTDVQNGKKYYYACVAYDEGDPNRGTKGLLPTETTKIISESILGEIDFIDINCAVVTPNAPVAGYVPPQVIGSLDEIASGFGSGSLAVTILNPDSVKDNASYTVKFHSNGQIPKYTTSYYELIREYGGVVDTVLERVDSTTFGAGLLGPLFDGIAVTTNNDTIGVDLEKTDWVKGYSNLYMPVRLENRFPLNKIIAWPADYEIEFLDGFTELSFNSIPINFKIKNITSGNYIQAYIHDTDPLGYLSLGDVISFMEIYDGQKFTWTVGYYPQNDGSPTPLYPSGGDIFRVVTTKPFIDGDSFTFQTVSSKIISENVKNELDQISVVPNPYIAAASWENKTISTNGRGERRIDFINLPATCTIRIYTVAGALVKTLHKDSSPLDGSLSWNLVSEDGMDVAFGLYIFHVEAPGIGDKIGKFALIK